MKNSKRCKNHVWVFESHMVHYSILACQNMDRVTELYWKKWCWSGESKMIWGHTQYLAPVRFHTLAREVSSHWFQTANWSWCTVDASKLPQLHAKQSVCDDLCAAVGTASWSAACVTHRGFIHARKPVMPVLGPIVQEHVFTVTPLPRRGFHVSSERREERAQPELTSCFCFATLRNVNDCANICSKFPF